MSSYQVGLIYMILKEFSQKRFITIDYYKNGLFKTCKGHVLNLNLNEQTLSVKDEQRKDYD